MTISSNRNYTSLKRFPAGIIHVEYIFPHCFYIFYARFTSLNIDDTVVCLSLADNMVRFGNFVVIIVFEFELFYVEVEMLCTKHIVFSLRNNFPIVLSGEE
jgi:hypothetical protein